MIHSFEDAQQVAKNLARWYRQLHGLEVEFTVIYDEEREGWMVKS